MSERDLDEAGRHFARAISLLGAQAVLALLLKAKPRVFRTRTSPVAGPPPPPRGRFRYRPRIRRDPSLPPGEGATSAWGDIVVSSRGSLEAKQLALLHERVHSILTPKLYILRNVRVQLRLGAYSRSHLMRYLEEAVAETVAQVGVRGFRNAVSGLTFPVRNGYVTLASMGTEATGILLGPITAGGMVYTAYYSATRPSWAEEE